MNQTQQKYLLVRIQETERMLIEKANAKYIITGGEITADEKFALVQTGKVKPDIKTFMKKIKVTTHSWNSNRIFDVPSGDSLFNFDPYHIKPKTDKKLPGLLQKIILKAQTMSDELILGDAKKALESLNKFMEMKI